MWRIVTGFLVGYYLGTKAGRERLDELQQALRTIATSQTFHRAIQDGSARLSGLTSGLAKGLGHGPGLEIARSLLARSPLGSQVAGRLGGVAQRALAAGAKRAA